MCRPWRGDGSGAAPERVQLRVGSVEAQGLVVDLLLQVGGIDRLAAGRRRRCVQEDAQQPLYGGRPPARGARLLRPALVYERRSR